MAHFNLLVANRFLDTDNAHLVLHVYQMMYPNDDMHLSNMREIIQKYGLESVGPVS